MPTMSHPEPAWQARRAPLRNRPKPKRSKGRRSVSLARAHQCGPTPFEAVGPHVGSPSYPGEPHSAARRIVVIFRETGNLVGDDPLRRKAALIGVRLGILRHRGITSVDAAGKISD